MSNHIEAKLATLAIHADNPLNKVTDVAPPIHLSTTFRYPDDPNDLTVVSDFKLSQGDITSHDFVYSRLAAPNSTRFEAILTALLKGRALAYGSGLAAFNAALVLLNPRRISVGENYHGCHGVIDIFKRVSGLQKLELDCPAEELQAGDLIFLETPLNPHGTAFNIEHYAQKAHSRGAFLLVDSTFGPPGLQDPFEWGADLVMHSGSKYFGGHSDLLCGVLATKRTDWFNQLFIDRLHLGNNMGNLESWLGVRSLRTLELRVQRASQSATKLVSHLHTSLTTTNPPPNSPAATIQSVLAEIRHASLQSDEWVHKQMPHGYGPVFSILMKSPELARKLPSKLHYFHHATSLGGVESLIEWRAMSDSRVDQRLLRVSVGVENVEDLIGDFVQAFTALAAE
ncbi:cystathionine gamma-synthase [Talaromyces proteolyticus]|uniref:Cystathionine gamma-synthase n=1 Tax=Talaromyces proteolyticus TaxID=1131652 RepID=A0AAD4PWX0_9EURO|nr:cystathionine gamma-synthase [Talaromyces proteolyticus]KAH8692352.1 cystathionine gamma-synthase [Talaromyces proteolyticus]